MLENCINDVTTTRAHIGFLGLRIPIGALEVLETAASQLSSPSKVVKVSCYMRVAMIVCYFHAFCTVCDVHAVSRVRSNVSEQHLYELPLAEITRPLLRRVRVYCTVGLTGRVLVCLLLPAVAVCNDQCHQQPSSERHNVYGDGDPNSFCSTQASTCIRK